MERKIKATKFDTKKLHPYDVKTKGKHPVHIIEYGGYITEDEGDYGKADLGWFYLNQKEYEYFKEHLEEIVPSK